jgi:hypothetical protein
MSIPFERPAPPVVTQSSMTCCWAAALESWRRAEEMPGNVSQEFLLGAFRSVPGALEGNTERATAEVGAGLIANFNWMQAAVYSGARLTANFWERRLQSGYIYVWYVRGNVGHCGVIYGVTPSVVKIMDPWKGRGLIEREINFFHSCRNALVGTGMLSGHVRNPFIGMFDAPPAPSRSSNTGLPGYNF